MRVLAETSGKVLELEGVDVLDARSGAVSRLTVITSYSQCPNLHQVSFHLSCTETILVICFRSVIKRQKNCEDTQDKWCKEHLWFGFLKNAENFFGGENTRFVYHCIRLGILHFVHTQPLPRLRALVLFYRKRFLHQCWHRTRMLLISFICRGIFCIKEKNLPGSFIDPDFKINIIIFSSSYIKLS